MLVNQRPANSYQFSKFSRWNETISLLRVLDMLVVLEFSSITNLLKFLAGGIASDIIRIIQKQVVMCLLSHLELSHKKQALFFLSFIWRQQRFWLVIRLAEIYWAMRTNNNIHQYMLVIKAQSAEPQ